MGGGFFMRCAEPAEQDMSAVGMFFTDDLPALLVLFMLNPTLLSRAHVTIRFGSRLRSVHAGLSTLQA